MDGRRRRRSVATVSFVSCISRCGGENITIKLECIETQRTPQMMLMMIVSISGGRATAVELEQGVSQLFSERRIEQVARSVCLASYYYRKSLLLYLDR